MKLKTLTVGDVTYTVCDPDAVKLDDEQAVTQLVQKVLQALPDGDEVAY